MAQGMIKVSKKQDEKSRAPFGLKADTLLRQRDGPARVTRPIAHARASLRNRIRRAMLTRLGGKNPRFSRLEKLFLLDGYVGLSDELHNESFKKAIMASARMKPYTIFIWL